MASADNRNSTEPRRPPTTTSPTSVIALATVFFAAGTMMATWATRTPALADGLRIDAALAAGLVAALAAGAAIGLVLAPRFGGWLGSRNGVMIGGALQMTGLAGLGVATDALHSLVLAIAGLVIYGIGLGAGDVLMNVDAARSEKLIGRTILPFLHAMFSIGTVAGAAVGVFAAAGGIPVSLHFGAVALLAGIALIVAASRFKDRDRTPRATGTAPRVRTRVFDRSLILIALTILGLSFSEGIATSWLTLASVRGHGLNDGEGAAVYGTFVVAMTASRLIAGPIVDRLGRRATVQIAIALTLAGLLTFALSPNFGVVAVGACLWGAGCAIGVPLGIGEAASDQSTAKARVGALAVVSYAGALALPALLGPVIDLIGYIFALLLPVALVVVSASTSRVFSTRPAGPATGASTERTESPS